MGRGLGRPQLQGFTTFSPDADVSWVPHHTHLYCSGTYGGLGPHPQFSDASGSPAAGGILVDEGCGAAGQS